MHMLYIGSGFIALQIVFHFLEQWMESHHEAFKHAKHGTFVAFVLHPTVVGGVHDLGIYVVAEFPKLVAGH
jgi:hypothetical protein